MARSTTPGSAFGAGSSCLHCMWVYSCPLSIDPPVKTNYRLFLSIKRPTQHRLCPVYRTSQHSKYISLIMKLYVRQARHHKFPRWCIYNANETDSILPQFFSSRHWYEVWVCANNTVFTSPWQHNILQKFCTMRDIVFIIFLLCLIPCRLNNTETHNNHQPTALRIMDLRPIIRIHVHFHIQQKTQIDTMTTLFVPPLYGLVNTDEILRREELCAILI